MRDVGEARPADEPVHGVAKKLLEILGRREVLAEVFLNPNGVDLFRELAVRAYEVVAEQIDLLIDGPAGDAEAFDGRPQPGEAGGCWR